MAGRRVRFEVVTKDSFGNLRGVGGDHFEVRLTRSQPKSHQVADLSALPRSIRSPHHPCSTRQHPHAQSASLSPCSPKSPRFTSFADQSNNSGYPLPKAATVPKAHTVSYTCEITAESTVPQGLLTLTSLPALCILLQIATLLSKASTIAKEPKEPKEPAVRTMLPKARPATHALNDVPGVSKHDLLGAR